MMVVSLMFMGCDLENNQGAASVAGNVSVETENVTQDSVDDATLLVY